MTPTPMGRSEYRAWCELLDRPFNEHRPTPADRAAALPAWAVAPLVATPAAREKLREWSRRAAVPPEELTPARVIYRLHAAGDDALLEPLTAVILGLPAPMRDYVVARAHFVLAGRSAAGWCGAIHEHDTATHPHEIMVTAGRSRAEFAAVARHECAHAWLDSPPPPNARSCGALRHSCLITAGRVPAELQDTIAATRAAYDAGEGAVDALLDALGFARPAPEVPW